MFRTMTALTIGAFSFVSGRRAEAADTAGSRPPGPPCLLFLSGRVQTDPPGHPNKYRLRTCLPDARLQRKLAEWGYAWSTDFFSTRMTWEFLTQFNAVIALDFPSISGLKAISRPAVEQRLTQVSRFGFIRTDVFDFFYPPNASSNWNKTDRPQRAKPGDAIRGFARVTAFTPWADGTSAYLVQGRLRAVRNVPQNSVLL